MYSRALVRHGLLIAGLAMLLMGCARKVPQHSNSGKDYRHRGAKAMELDGDEARVRDIVTYPGGDRVDWKVIELPEGQRGTLRIKLRWRPPRPGLDVAFNVYDAYFERVGRAKPAPNTRRTRKSVKISDASGKYYIQVYAPRRTDAGRYTLSARFKARKQPKVLTAADLVAAIEDPPLLPEVVEPKEKTPEELAAEQAEQERLAAEAAAQEEQDRLDAARRAELSKPVLARVIGSRRSSNGVVITISAGKDRDIEKGWVGTLLRGSSDSPLPGSEFTVIRVRKSESTARVQLSMDQVRANSRVALRRAVIE